MFVKNLNITSNERNNSQKSLIKKLSLQHPDKVGFVAIAEIIISHWWVFPFSDLSAGMPGPATSDQIMATTVAESCLEHSSNSTLLVSVESCSGFFFIQKTSLYCIYIYNYY